MENTRKELSNSLNTVLLNSMGLKETTFTRRLGELLFGRAINRLADLALQLDEKLSGGDPSVGMRWILPYFMANFSAQGSERIPQAGPLLLIANHPASYDALLISAFIHRPDYRIFIGKISPYDHLPNISHHAIFSPPKGDTSGRMTTLRQAIRHLQGGGSLLIFPRGDIEPDPALEVQPALVMDTWSRSLDIFLRRVPDLQVVAAAVSGVIAPQALRHPFTWFKRKQTDRQRLAYIYQLIQQVLRRDEVFGLHGRINFSHPIHTADPQDAFHVLQEMTQKTFRQHLILFYPKKIADLNSVWQCATKKGDAGNPISPFCKVFRKN